MGARWVQQVTSACFSPAFFTEFRIFAQQHRHPAVLATRGMQLSRHCFGCVWQSSGLGHSWLPGRSASPGSAVAGLWRRCGSGSLRQQSSSLCKLGGAPRRSQTHVFQNGPSPGIRSWKKCWLRSCPPCMVGLHLVVLVSTQNQRLGRRPAAPLALHTAVETERRMCPSTAPRGGGAGALGVPCTESGCRRAPAAPLTYPLGKQGRQL